MSNAGSGDGLWNSLKLIVSDFGLGGSMTLGGVVLIGITLYKAESVAEGTAQLIFLAGGLICGVGVLLVGLILLGRQMRTGANARKLDHGVGAGAVEHDVFIAAPMAGFAAGEEHGRKAAVEMVRSVEAALRRLPELQNVYTPVLARPDADQYETPATAFNAELAALSSSKRYVLILPAVVPVGTSVLVTAGMAFALKLPCVIFACEGKQLPYLVEGAVQSREVNVYLYRYSDTNTIEHMIQNDGVRLFGPDNEP